MASSSQVWSHCQPHCHSLHEWYWWASQALLNWLRGLRLQMDLVTVCAGAVLAAHAGLLTGKHVTTQLSPFLAYRNHLHPALHRVQDAVSSQPAQDWHLTSMAAVACTSPRHLTRLFMAHADIAPLQYLRRIRLAMAQTALQSGCNVTQAAALAGFSSDTQLRRAWHQLGESGTPSHPN